MAKVFVVLGGWNHEGEHADSIKVFLNEKSALEYGESLVSDDVCPYDYFEVKECEVE